MRVGIVLVDIEKYGTEIALIHLAFDNDSSSSRYPPSSFAVAGMLCNLSHHVLQIYKIYNTELLVYLQSLVNTNILPTNVLYSNIFYTKAFLWCLSGSALLL